MLTPKPQLKLSNAKGYFREHLAVGDYYMDGHVVAGEWRGVGAVMLGLEGRVTEESFQKLCDGLNPETGEWLTARRNTTRREGSHTVANRRVFYDFTISPPKSVSVIALCQDSRIIEIHDRATRVMMDELEKYAETRVRIGGADSERETGGVVAAMFRHDTSRELDPHLHTHCIVFNATYDAVEDRWKALHATGMYRAQKFAEHLYYHELAKGLRALGYEIENNARDFEIKGVPAEVVSRFSKRHQQIDEETKKRIAEEGLRGNEKALREQVAHDRRKRKTKNAVADRLRPKWESEMPPGEREALTRMSPPKLPPPLPGVLAQKAGIPELVAWANAHLFERKSVVADHELLATALARGRGQNFSLKQLREVIASTPYIRDSESNRLTIPEVLARERDVVLAARDGRWQHVPLNNNFTPSNKLSAEQTRAVQRILNSVDFITLFQGGAGTGKSFTLREVVRGLTDTGHPLLVLAPQHQQADDLRRDGLEGAITLARALAQGRLPTAAVVILDEAGQVGAKDMLALIRQVQVAGGRLILSGDTCQQGAVAASDALRAIEQYSLLTPVRLTTIRRQDPAKVSTEKEKTFVRIYRRAVECAAQGRTAESYDLLDKAGCISELPADELNRELAREYCAALDRGDKVLAVAQTWDEVRGANAAIRERLKNEGKLDAGQPMESLQSLDLSEAQKRDARFYTGDAKVWFVRDYGRFKRGDCCEVASADGLGVALGKDGKTTTVSYRYADRFVVVKTHQQELARGDRLQMKFNGDSIEGKAVRNGELVTMCRVLKDKSIQVRDDAGTIKTLSPAQRMFVPGYAITSYASQGKTVDTVLAAYSGERMPVNQNQWYVAISRARRRVKIFTEDKELLRVHVEQGNTRELALSICPQELTETASAQITQIPAQKIRMRRNQNNEEHQRQIAMRTYKHAAMPKLPPMPGIRPVRAPVSLSREQQHQPSNHPSINNRGIKI